MANADVIERNNQEDAVSLSERVENLRDASEQAESCSLGFGN